MMETGDDKSSVRSASGKRATEFGKLTNPEIKQAKPKEKPYRMPDGGNLYLEVSPNGSKRWFLKYFFAGKESRLALGVYPAITLAAARDKAREAKKQLAEGIDPNDAKRQAKLARTLATDNSFAAVAAEWYAKQSAHWSATHKTRTVGILQNNLCQWLGQRPIGDIKASELLAALRKTESKGTLETAKRALQIAGQVFRYAVITDRAERDPSQDLKGALATPKGTHFAAITEPAALGKLLLAIDGYNGTPEVKTALLLSPLLFQRPGEIRHMEWAELDWKQERWEIPADKMKMRQPHIVPLSKQVQAMLRGMQPLTGHGKYVFPSAKKGGRPMSENAVRAALRTLGYTNEQQTPHGFRATARTILDEVLGFRVDWIEHQLAHTVKDTNGRAYNRTAHLDARKDMMQKWADYLDELRAVARGENVIPSSFNRIA
jgi:integrase